MGCFNLVSLFLVLLSVSFIHGHMYLSSLKINGVALAEGDCVRLVHTNSPISSVDSTDMTCGFRPASTVAANRKCPVAAGSTIGLQWYHESPSASDDIVDGSHRGPCLVYMAKDDGSNNPNWFKIYENGYDTATSKFCVDTLITNRGLMQMTIPSDIAPGNYLIRGEVIALHSAYDVGGAQPYVGCGELTVTGSGNANPSTVKLPGAYKATDPGLHISIYPVNPPYIIPGPAVYSSKSSSGGGASSSGGVDNSNGSKSSSGGMSGGGVAALVIFFIALAGLTAYGAFYYHKNGHIFGKTLPPQIANLFPSSSSSSSSNYDRRNNGGYTAYVESQQ